MVRLTNECFVHLENRCGNVQICPSCHPTRLTENPKIHVISTSLKLFKSCLFA